MWHPHPSRRLGQATAFMRSFSTAANSTKKKLSLWVQPLVNTRVLNVGTENKPQYVLCVSTIRTSVFARLDCTCITIMFFHFEVYVKTFPSCSSLTRSFLSFTLLDFYLFASFFSLFLLDSVSSTALLCPLCCCFCLLLSISQSRIPGTVIPLCAAQCERIFNTTRTPGEETGKESNVHTHRHGAET